MVEAAAASAAVSSELFATRGLPFGSNTSYRVSNVPFDALAALLISENFDFSLETGRRGGCGGGGLENDGMSDLRTVRERVVVDEADDGVKLDGVVAEVDELRAEAGAGVAWRRVGAAAVAERVRVADVPLAPALAPVTEEEEEDRLGRRGVDVNASACGSWVCWVDA